jgi:Arc/MetJ-type ribon-helix-helix transcriptional regulator
MTTINISLPKSLLDEAKAMLKKKHYASISELIRHSLRKTLSEEDPNAISVNGFPNWFEDKVLEAEKEPIIGTWKTEEDIHKYFDNLKKKIRARKKNNKDYLQR